MPAALYAAAGTIGAWHFAYLKNLSLFALTTTALAITTATQLMAQQPAPIQDGQILPLWTGTPPGALGSAESDIPTVTVYLPRTMGPNAPAMIVCPGGGYGALA